MLHAILSDIHSNLEALLAVVDAADAEGATSILCLGDVVGYGADPSEVISVVSGCSNLTVRGNHDQAAIQPGAEARMNDWARAAAVWTRERMSGEDVSFLSGLPLKAGVDGALLVHASPRDPENWGYILNTDAASRAFLSFRESLCFIGHSHVPAFFEETDGGARATALEELRLEAARRYIVNVGSVGQPRDGDPRACFALFDSVDRTVRTVRVDYDADVARDKIIEAGLPRELGERLLKGH